MLATEVGKNSEQPEAQSSCSGISRLLSSSPIPTWSRSSHGHRSEPPADQILVGSAANRIFGARIAVVPAEQSSCPLVTSALSVDESAVVSLLSNQTYSPPDSCAHLIPALQPPAYPRLDSRARTFTSGNSLASWTPLPSVDPLSTRQTSTFA